VSEQAPVAHVECPKCLEALPIFAGKVRIEGDPDEQTIRIEPDLTEVWAHAWTHDFEGES
jgi:hypothetical protein